jgi:excisionase family DNA binding protein
MPAKPSSLLLSLRYPEASAATGLSQRTLSTLVREGRIPFLRVGRTVLFPVAELERWLASLAKGGAS